MSNIERELINVLKHIGFIYNTVNTNWELQLILEDGSNIDCLFSINLMDKIKIFTDIDVDFPSSVFDKNNSIMSILKDALEVRFKKEIRINKIKKFLNK